MKISHRKYISPIGTFWKVVICVYAVLTILLIVGSFLDWQIDQGMYKGAYSWGNYTSWMAGMAFFLTGAFVSGFMIAKPLVMWKQNKVKGYLAIIISVALLLGLICLNAWNFKDSVIGQIGELYTIPKLHPSTDLPWINADGSTNHGIVVGMSCGLAAAALLISCIGGYSLMTSKNGKIASSFTFKWALWALVCLIVATLVVTKMKDSMPRARFFQFTDNGVSDYRNITGVTYDVSFRNWWELAWNPSVYNNGSALVINAAFTSFPSGHTTWACSAIVFIPVILGATQCTIKRSLYLSIIACFIAFIMLSRLSAGCHFLTDVTVAVLFNSAIYAAGRLAFNKINI